ncbi:MAG: HNH endonuclease [Phycisphaerae bacterium]
MHQSLQGATFHVEHVVPKVHGGNDDRGNLAWCCPSCNLNKAGHVDGTDPLTAEIAPLFHPRESLWDDHFAWSDERLVGRTPVGRATVDLLKLNTPRRQLIRKAERSFGLFPPR